MGSYAYILVAAFIMTGSIFLFAQRGDADRANLDLGRIQMKQEARQAASSALSISMRLLAADQDPWLVAENYDVEPYSYGDPPATYESVVTIVDSINGDTLDVVATGTKVYTRRNRIVQDTTHIIEVRIARGVLSNATPPGFRSAIMADNTLTIQGDFSLNSLIDGQNADLHTNGTLDARGNSFLVEGMGTYTNGVRINATQMDNFVPDNDWNHSDDNVFQRDSISLPTWDHETFTTDAQTNGYYTTDPMVVDGDVLAAAEVTTVDEFAESILGLPPGDYGVIEDEPLLVMVDNELTFDNAIYLSGYVQFGATGDIDVNTHGSDDGIFIAYTADLENKEAYTHAGIFTTGGIRVEGNATIQATMYAEGAITYLGGTHLIGGQVAKETTFQGGGTVDIDWVGAGTGVLEYFDPYDEPIGPVIIAYSEW
jgi:hypothetical protein